MATLPTQRQIRAAIAAYHDKDRKRARGEGFTRAEIEAAVRRKFPAASPRSLSARLNNVKATWIYAEVLAPGKHGLWLFDGCPHPCDLCIRMCRYTGVHYDRHRCDSHMGPAFP